jgi:adenylyl cyclase-associated protein
MPVPTAESFIETSAFYGNKILREKQEHQVAWVKSLNEVLKANVGFIRENFASGILWNPKGKDFSEALKTNQEEVKQTPPKPQKKTVEETKVPLKAAKVPKKYERGISWVFEHYENARDLELAPEDTGMKKAVMIDNCINSLIQIRGKVKSIIISGCKSTSIVFQDVVSSVEIINSQKLQIQATGKVSSISIDKTDGIQIYVLRESYQDIMFTTSKSADMNIIVPGPTPDDDSIEIPIPHQFVHRFENGKVKSSPSELYSH